MDVLGWLLVWLACNLVVSIIAGRRGRNGWLVFFLNCVAAICLSIAVSFGLGNNMAAKEWAMPLVAWLVLGASLLWSISAQNERELAEELGEYGDLKRCPFCAEAVKKAAVKCKHCGSNLPADA